MRDFTDTLRPAEPSGPSILATQRSHSNVPVEELSQHLLSHGNFLGRQARILPFLEKDRMFNKAKQSNLSRPERYHLGLARAKKLRRLADQHGWDQDDYDMAAYLCDDVSPYMVHIDMFIGTVREQGSDEQKAYWMPRIESWEVIGCYAQTELGHGSNVRGIECQARWVPESKEFVIHSPTLTASKWWNGYASQTGQTNAEKTTDVVAVRSSSMGRTANHAIVVAQLLVPKSNGSSELVSHGPHPFIVQIRDLETHQSLPGIAVGDIGPKYGYAPMDNGYMLFDQVRVPHNAMLSKYSFVDPNTCTYSKPANPAVVYGSLTAVRAKIVMRARMVLARAVTVAVRYTAIRRQFSDRDDGSANAPELSVLDYPTVQIRILPLLATAFALHYTGSAMQALYENIRAEISKGDFSKLAELHSQSSGLKSLCTDYAANGIETSRRALGGHGFGGGSGLIQLNADYLSKPTVEGDNWMITQQTASYLIKRMAAAEASEGDPKDEVERSCRQYLSERDRLSSNDFKIFESDEQIIAAFQRRSRHLTHMAHVQRNKKKQPWNSLTLLLRKVSNAESESLLIANFSAALRSDASISAQLKPHLQKLFRLYAYYTMDVSAREFAKAQAVPEEDLDRLPHVIQDLMAEIRPHAVNLVDAWCIPDYLLDSALGRYDGKVYEDLFNRAHRLNPLNEVTFNADYRSEEIVRGGDGKEMERILAKL